MTEEDKEFEQSVDQMVYKMIDMVQGTNIDIALGALANVVGNIIGSSRLTRNDRHSTAYLVFHTIFKVIDRHKELSEKKDER